MNKLTFIISVILITTLVFSCKNQEAKEEQTTNENAQVIDTPVEEPKEEEIVIEMDGKIKIINESNFETYTKTGLVLVDFYADWCGPCKMMLPVLENFAATYANKIIVTKINIDNNPVIAQFYKIRSIPLLILFKDGEIVKSMLGYHDNAKLLEELKEFLTE